MCLSALLGGAGGAPSIPAPPAPPPPPPTRDDPQVNADADAERRRRLAAKGANSTIGTSPLGVEEAANTGQKTLLGA